MILSNLFLTFIVGYGIYDFSSSLLWAIVGAIVITGSASANPIFALLAFPAVEYFFNPAGMTIYSAIVVGITMLQMILVFTRPSSPY